MRKAVKIICVLFCLAPAVVLLECKGGEVIRGVYKTDDTSRDSLEFKSGSNVIINLDGERLDGTYKITGKTIIISIKNSSKLIVLTFVDKNTFVRRHNGAQIFTKR
jgi:hypothetical protein